MQNLHFLYPQNILDKKIKKVGPGSEGVLGSCCVHLNTSFHTPIGSFNTLAIPNCPALPLTLPN